LARSLHGSKSVRHWIAVAIAALSCGAASSGPSGLVYDPFEARSQLLSFRAVATNFMISLVEFQELADAAKKKFGEDAKTVLHGDTGKVDTILNGKVVETSMIKARVEDVFGIFSVGRRRDEMARFPFALGVGAHHEQPRDVGKTVRNRFPRLSDFKDSDWTNLSCWSQEAPEAGAQFTDAAPRLGRADLCLVRWRPGEGKTMLIGALTADGGDWVRDASRPICRVLAAQWLETPRAGVQGNTIDYVSCVLVHDPDRGTRGAGETVADHLYEVRPDRSLALIN
jgi:hypothetical protein